MGAAPADPCGHIKSLCDVSTVQCDSGGGDRFWRCELDKLQVRLVLPRGERAVWAEPGQGTGPGWEWGSEQAGLRPEWSAVNLWIRDRRSVTLLLAFAQQGSG